jgi:hypothetical protein
LATQTTRWKLEGIAPYDGEWPIDLSYFTNDEFRTIKRLSGVLSPDVNEAFLAGDNDLYVATVVIALQRAGQVVEPEGEAALWRAHASSMTLIVEEEPDLDPPAQPPTELGGNGDGTESTETSGESSGPGSESSQQSQPDTGAPA